jgi:hypothetical protein
MKRIVITSTAAFLLIVIFVFILAFQGKPDPGAPRFILATSQPVGSFGSIYYDWSDPVVFRGSKVWVFTWLSRTNHHMYLYDIDKRQVIGELLNGGAVFCNQTETKLLCAGWLGDALPARERLFRLLNRLSRGELNLPTNNISAYWILDLSSNRARKIGCLSERPGYGSSWQPAPGFRFGYDVPSTVSGDGEFFLCDLEKATLGKIKFPGRLQGWWDDHRLLMRDRANDFVLFDVITHDRSTVLKAKTIAAYFKKTGLEGDASSVRTLFHWNDKDYDVYLTGDKGGEWKYTNETFVVKIDRESRTLSLLYSNFQFRWLGRFDATATHYVYPGEKSTFGAGGNGGVRLLDLANNTTRTVVEPDNRGQYSLPRFYGDGVVYSTNRVPWRINLNGNNAMPLFAPTNR